MDDRTRRRNFANAFDATSQITGEDVSKIVEARDLQDQRNYLAAVLRDLLGKGFSPMLLIEMFLAGAAFLGDNFGVSRGQMSEKLKQVTIGEDRTIIVTPSNG